MLWESNSGNLLMRTIFNLCFCVLILYCQAANAAGYNITGSFTGFKNGVKVYLLDKESEDVVDSTIIDKGRFQLKGHLEHGPMYLSVEIRDQEGRYQTLVFAGSGAVSISGDKNDFPYNVSVSGSLEQNRYNAYLDLVKPIYMAADAAFLTYTKAKPDTKMEAGLAYNKIGDKKRRILKKWIFANKDSYFAANQIYNYVNELPRDSIDMFYAELPGNLQHSIYGKRIYAYLTKGDTLKISDKYFDFEAYDAFGKKLTLSSFSGKYILLDFSSVACGPCRASIDELRLISQKYKDQLSVISYTLDKHSDWQQQIKDDNVTWTTVIDPEGNYSKTQLKYNIQLVPAFYLISPKGIILDKWTGYEKVASGTGELEKHLLNVGLAKNE